MENLQQQPMQGKINLNLDTTPVLFTDTVFWNLAPDSVVLNFGQNIMGSNNQVKIVSRVGLTREFLKKFLSDLTKNMALTEAQGQTGKLKS